MTKTHRGWTISLNYINEWDATGPNYDASYEGPEDGWVSNGQSVSSATLEGVRDEIDAWIAENEGICACGQPLDDNFECAVCRLSGEPTYSDYLIKTFKQIEHIFAKAAKP